MQALPHGFRARAFGVMQSGTQVMQGAAVLLTGLLADRFSIGTVVGLWSVAGVVLILIAATQWPSADRFNTAVAAAGSAQPVPPPVPENRTVVRQNGVEQADKFKITHALRRGRIRG